MNLKKILMFAGIALLLFFLISRPDESANMVLGILATLQGAAESIITFVQNLF
ncbi:hypothetical protein [Actinoalloteichus hymeniacidonis]|uniref:Uncharacterized protein n=1 Tax=Actinoalloteichus hymeniacidonis TaxID=340345 RepID=A0AAC9HMX7_9PSEU|nr:hypothetical protein [Actinoalloteichus hymeniacidonis]AOS61775.1 hypothetical protein TL08_04725 [Actinoalloteichus hymeniacidonis]MBB5910206.1 hypothetical protein [Actinoalloteichus hymeniacidonis]